MELEKLRRDQDPRELRDQVLIFDHALLHVAYERLRMGRPFGDWTLEEIIALHKKYVDEMLRRGFSHRITGPLDEALPPRLKKILDELGNFRIKSPFLYITGCICNNYYSSYDIDIVINGNHLPDQVLAPIRALMEKHLGQRCHIMENEYGTPFTDFWPVYDLALTRLDSKVYALHKTLIPINPEHDIEPDNLITLDDIDRSLPRTYKLIEPIVALLPDRCWGSEIWFYIPFSHQQLFIPIAFRIFRAFERDFAQDFRFTTEVFDESILPLYALSLEKKRRHIIQMDQDLELERIVEKQALPRAPKAIQRQAEESLRDDKVRPGIMVYPIKPTRGAYKGQPQTIESFLELVKDYDFSDALVSKKMDGFRALLFKKGDKITIISDDGTDITERFPWFVKRMKKFSPENLTLDAEFELWEEETHLPREATAGYAHLIGPPDDSNIVANVFDILYIGDEDVHKLPARERYSLLKRLKFDANMDEIPPKTPLMNLVPQYEVNNIDELREAVIRLSDLPASEGVILKSGPYELDGKSKLWWKYHKSVYVTMSVIERLATKVPTIFNYVYGIPNPKPVLGLKPSPIVKVKGVPHLRVGKTFNTTQIFAPGDRIVVEFETANFIRYLGPKTYSITFWVPSVLDIEPEKETATADEIIRKAKKMTILTEKVVRADGTIEYKFLDSEFDALKETQQARRVADPYMQIQDETKRYRYSFQIHARGKGFHGDLRFETQDPKWLLGITLAIMIPGTIKENITSIADVKRIIKKVRAKIDFETGEFMLRQRRGGVIVATYLFSAKKAPEPAEWFEYTAVIPPGRVGATPKLVGVVYTYDIGPMSYGAQKPYFHEYFCAGKMFHGRYIFRSMAGILRSREAQDFDIDEDGTLWWTEDGRIVLQRSDELIKSSDIKVLFKQPIGGIYLVPPHGEMIATGKKTAIVKSRAFHGLVGVPLYIVSGTLAYGALILKPPRIIDLDEFERLRPKHQISDAERKEWWPGVRKLFYYEFDLLHVFDPPLPVEVPPGVQTFITEVIFKQQRPGEILPPAEIPEEEALRRPGWLFMRAVDLLPYTLSKRAVRLKWMPPVGISALPRYIRRQVPDEFQYWKEKTLAAARSKRDALVAAKIDFKLDSKGEP